MIRKLFVSSLNTCGITPLLALFCALLFLLLTHPLQAAITNLSLTTPAVTSPQPAGTTIPLHASCSYDGEGDVEYMFRAIAGSTTYYNSGYSLETQVSWTPSATGSYSLRVDVREVGTTTNYFTTVTFLISSIASISLSTPGFPSPQNPGEITLQAGATYNGNGTLEYKFSSSLSGTEGISIVQDFTTASSCSWNPTATGRHKLYLYVREQGCVSGYERLVEISSYVISSIDSITLSSSPEAPMPCGSEITLAADVSYSGLGTLEYKFQYRVGDVYTTIRDYTTSSTCVWNSPTTSGNYLLYVFVREVGCPSVYEVATMVYNMVSPLTGLTLTSPNTTFPQPTGNHILLRATPTLSAAATIEYQFKTYIGGAYQTIRNFATDPDFIWIPTTAGTYNLYVYARQVGSFSPSEKSAYILSRSIIAATPPTVSLTSPVNGAIILNTDFPVSITATATDDVSISKTEFYCDGELMAAGDTTAPYSFSWNNATPGHYTLTARAYDNYGTSTLSAPVAVTINTLPVIELTSPLVGSVHAPFVNLQLKATASDPDTGDSIDHVNFYQGETLLDEGTLINGEYVYTWQNVQPGTYTLTAKAYDTRNAITTSDAITIRVNAPPVITTLTPANGTIIPPPASVLLTVAGTDSDGTVVRAEFYNAATNALLGIDTEAPFTCSWTDLPEGDYTVHVRLYDNDGTCSTTGVMQFSVNTPPFVTIMSPMDSAVIQSNFLPCDIYVDALDNDGISRVEYYANGALLGQVTMPMYGYYDWNWSPTPGTYTLTAKAYDTRGAVTTSTSITVHVNQVPTITSIQPAYGTVLTAPADAVLQVTGTDADGTISRVEFYDMNTWTLLGTDTEAPFTFTWENVPGGSYSVYVRLYDNDNGVATANTSFIVNEPPQIAITWPWNGGIIHSNMLPAYISATATDADGISRVEFFANEVLLGQDTMPMYGYYDWNWSPTSGTYTLTAKAYDTRGAVTTSTSITVRVNQAPVITGTQPAFGTVFNEPADVLIEVTGTDADGTVARVEFYDAGTFELLHTATAAPFTFSWEGLPAGTHTARVQLYDNDGGWESSYVTFVVNDLPQVSIIDPQDGRVIHSNFLPTAISATATDADGISRVEFFANEVLLGQDTTLENDQYMLEWNPTPGTYILTVKAYDTHSAVTTSSPVTVRVNALPLFTSFLPANGSTFTAPATVLLEVTGTDQDGSVVKAEFYYDNTGILLHTVTEAPFTFLFENLPGNLPDEWHHVTVLLYDNDGGYAIAHRAFRVEGTTNVPPTVTITAPANDTHFTAPIPIPVQVIAADETFGDQVTVDIYRNGTLLGRAQQVSGEYLFTWDDAAPGTYTLTARAFDRWGAVTVSAPITIVVYPNTPPTVALVSPVDGEILLGPTNIQLQATAFDTNVGDGISLVEFYANGSLLGEGELVSSEYQFSWSDVPEGIYFLTAVAYDERGAMTISEPVMLIINPNTSPVVQFVSPNNGTVFAEPATIQLRATAFDEDSGDSISKVEFFEGMTLLGEGQLVDGEYVFSWENVPAGVYRLTIKAYDQLGAVGLATRVVIVNSGDALTLFTHDGWDAAVSGDGRYISFVSDAADIVTGDVNSVADVFLIDCQTGVTQRVNLGMSQEQANATSWGVVISRNGRYIAFVSDATNLVSNDSNGQPDIFCYDQQAGTLVRINVNTNGMQANGTSWDIALSANGQFIAFTSDATNLVAGDTNGQADIFLHDQLAESTVCVTSVASNGPSWGSSMSADGNTIHFLSDATNLVSGDTNGVTDTFAFELPTGSITRLGNPIDGMQSGGGTSTSDDGNFVVIASDATNLDVDDTNECRDIFIYNRTTDVYTRVVLHDLSAIIQPDAVSWTPVISGDGMYIAFTSEATNLPDTGEALPNIYRYSLQDDELIRVGLCNQIWNPSISTDGSLIVYIAGDSVADGIESHEGVFETVITP